MPPLQPQVVHIKHPMHKVKDALADTARNKSAGYILDDVNNLYNTFQVSIITRSQLVITGKVQLTETGQNATDVTFICGNDVTSSRGEIEDNIERFLKDVKSVANGSARAQDLGRPLYKKILLRLIPIVFLGLVVTIIYWAKSTVKHRKDIAPLDKIMYQQGLIIATADSIKQNTPGIKKKQRIMLTKKFDGLVAQYDSIETLLNKQGVYADTLLVKEVKEKKEKFASALQK